MQHIHQYECQQVSNWICPIKWKPSIEREKSQTFQQFLAGLTHQKSSHKTYQNGNGISISPSKSVTK